MADTQGRLAGAQAEAGRNRGGFLLPVGLSRSFEQSRIPAGGGAAAQGYPDTGVLPSRRMSLRWSGWRERMRMMRYCQRRYRTRRSGPF